MLTPAIRAMDYPCLCLWRGFVQMTMVLPCRLITRQRSHMGLTDALTFIRVCPSSVSVGDAPASEVIGRELDLHLVPREDPDVVLPHLSGDRGEDGVTSVELHPKHRARERLGDLTLHFDLLFFVRQLAFPVRAHENTAGGPPPRRSRVRNGPFPGL